VLRCLVALFERLGVHIQSFAKGLEVSLRILSIILPSRVVSSIEIVNKAIEKNLYRCIIAIKILLIIKICFDLLKIYLVADRLYYQSYFLIFTQS
jgi:predicted RecB family endonuclease